MSSAGNKLLPTPNLDRIAREGVRFEDANCAYPVCVPSRTAMLTGRSVANTHVHGNDAAQDQVSDPGPSFDNILSSAAISWPGTPSPASSTATICCSPIAPV